MEKHKMPSMAEVTAETIELTKQALGGQPSLRKDGTYQGFQPGMGLYGYPLEAPAKQLAPVD